MTPGELYQLLLTSGIECQVRRSEVVVRVCTSCGNEKWNLELNAERGVYHAWCCRKGGRVDTLLQKLTGQEHHVIVRTDIREPKQRALPAPAVTFKSVEVSAVGSAAQYLAARGIMPTTAAQYGVVVCTEPGHRLEGRIAIPARDFWSGDVVGWVGRSYTGKRPKYLSTLPRKVITGWRHRSSTPLVVVVEGPLDGVITHHAGFDAAVLGGIGATGVVEWAARLSPKAIIAIMLDGDALQQAHKLFWQISPLRAAPVLLIPLAGGEDPASLGVEKVREAVWNAAH